MKNTLQLPPKPEFESDYERGFVMQKIAEQRLDMAWMKAMTTRTGLLAIKGLADYTAAQATAEKLDKAMTLLNEAKWEILNLPTEKCAAFHNDKGGQQTADEIKADFRNVRFAGL